MTAILIDAETVTGGAEAVRLRPVRSQVHTRATPDPRSTVRHSGAALVVHPVTSCTVERHRPRVTLTESVVPTAGAWRVTDRGLAVMVIAIMLAFAAGAAVMIAQFLAVTGG